MRQVARVTAVLAAITWLVGAPLFVMAGVPFSSDSQYIVLGGMAGLLALTLTPVTVAIGGPVRSLKSKLIRFSGLVVCSTLGATGLLLILGATGRIGERVSHVVPDAVGVGLLALFIWIPVASWALRGPSRAERSTFWLGLLTGSACILPSVASLAIFYLAKDVVFTNNSVLPVLLIELCLWLSLPAWLIAVVARLSLTNA